MFVKIGTKMYNTSGIKKIEITPTKVELWYGFFPDRIGEPMQVVKFTQEDEGFDHIHEYFLRNFAEDFGGAKRFVEILP